jgi:hypothetical protein
MLDLSTLDLAMPWRWDRGISDNGRPERRFFVGGVCIATVERLPGSRFRLHNLLDDETTDDFESAKEAADEIEADIADQCANLMKRKAMGE